MHLLPAFGDAALESIGVGDVEAFQANLAQRVHNGRPITPRTRNKILNVLHGVFQRAKKVWALTLNPAAQLERHPSRSSGDIEVYAPEEVWALVRGAADERDASVYLIAAFTGLRMGELRALRWRGRRLPAIGHPGARELRRGRVERPQARQGPLGPDGA